MADYQPAHDQSNNAQSIKDQLLAKFEDRRAHVAVIGLGYVGLPLALTFAQAGYKVTGIELSAQRVEMVNRGVSHIEDISDAELAAYVRNPQVAQPQVAQVGMVPSVNAEARSAKVTFGSAGYAAGSGSLSATTDYSILRECDAVSICVPTPLNKTGDPDMSFIHYAGEEIARYLHPGMVIVLESTTYPGTTREVLLSIFEEKSAAAGEKLEIGKDFFLAFSPERIDPGRKDYMTRNTPKVIGGVTPACLETATAFYGKAIETLVPVSSPEAAEMVKLLENTFRLVNIGLANELLLMCDKLGLDAWEVIDAASTKPFGFMRFTPGPGLGGHCIPIDPQYLSWKLRTLEYTARFVQLASEINTEMPRYWARKVQDALNDQGKAVKGSRILLLGIAYKKNISDLRESPALDIMHLLEEKGAHVEYYDPHLPHFHYEGFSRTGITDLHHALTAADCVVIATDHDAFDWDDVRAAARLVVDTRHVI
jgi:UDP-N-acetyl-D-glucosamine dehydrogenase